jgi:hypothetical protein
MNCVVQHIRGRPTKRWPAAKQLIEHSPEAVLVTGRQCDRLTSIGLLRGEVGRGTEYQTRWQWKLTRIGSIGDAEIHEVCSTVIVEPYVCRLDISVDNAL